MGLPSDVRANGVELGFDVFVAAVDVVDAVDFGFAFGGPILQDKMHFFVTYEGKRYSQPVAVTYANTPPAEIIAALGGDFVVIAMLWLKVRVRHGQRGAGGDVGRAVIIDR